MSKEVKIAVIGGIFLIIATICGAIITVAITPNGNKESNPIPQPPSTVSIVIYDHLGSNQVSETVDIFIDGNKRGSIVIDQNRPDDSMTITMPPGRYSYTLNAAAIFSDQNTYYGTGQGIIEVAEGKKYQLESSISGSTWLITLVSGAKQPKGKIA